MINIFLTSSPVDSAYVCIVYGRYSAVFCASVRSASIVLSNTNNITSKYFRFLADEQQRTWSRAGLCWCFVTVQGGRLNIGKWRFKRPLDAVLSQ